MSRTERQTIAGYFAVQGFVGLFFWFVVTGSAQGRELFDLLPGHPRVTDAFFAADLFTVVCSWVAAYAVWSKARWALVMVAFTTGCIVYPTVYLLTWAPTSAGGLRCLVIMVPPSLIGLWLTRWVWRAEQRAAQAPKLVRPEEFG